MLCYVHICTKLCKKNSLKFHFRTEKRTECKNISNYGSSAFGKYREVGGGGGGGGRQAVLGQEETGREWRPICPFCPLLALEETRQQFGMMPLAASFWASSGICPPLFYVHACMQLICECGHGLSGNVIPNVE